MSAFPAYACIIFTTFSQQVIIYASLCLVIGFYYGAAISKKEAATLENTGDTICPSQQIINARKRYPELKPRSIREAKHIIDSRERFPELKPHSKIKVLKNTIRKQTKGLTTHIQHYCKTKKPMGPAVDTQNPNGYRMYFDFTHSFLYCPNSKVNL